MKHLIISVSPDSSLDLLSKFADVILLDEEPTPEITTSYESLYIRSHFSQKETMPQNFHMVIDRLVKQAKKYNSNIKFIDDVDNIDTIIALEDKWLQYQTYLDYMPKTVLLSEANQSYFNQPIYKSRLSSRGSGIAWDRDSVVGSIGDWIVQEALDIEEELRVYVVNGNVHPVGAVRRSMTSAQKTEAVSFRSLTFDEILFTLRISKIVPAINMIGLDIAYTVERNLYLIEVNRSPGFAAFWKLTGVNLAALLYDESL